jgi:hypothetical protein
MSEQICETCKHFEAKALLDVVHLCHNPDLQVDTLDGTPCYLFQPPSYDFGCKLWSSRSPAPVAQ